MCNERRLLGFESIFASKRKVKWHLRSYGLYDAAFTRQTIPPVEVYKNDCGHNIDHHRLIDSR